MSLFLSLFTKRSTNATRANAGDAYHFVLSKAQEDEIREHFLVDKLKNYTQVRQVSSVCVQREVIICQPRDQLFLFLNFFCYTKTSKGVGRRRYSPTQVKRS